MAESVTPVASRPLMDGYGVPDDDEGLLPWSWAEERLVRSRNYWLVTANADGRPHAMPLWGAWIRSEDVFFFSCAPDSRKARNIRANPMVVVTADDTIEVVSVEGVATELDDDEAEQLRRYLIPFVDKYEELPSLEEVEEFFSSNAAFVVRPERAFSIIERPEDFGPRATKWEWPRARDRKNSDEQHSQ